MDSYLDRGYYVEIRVDSDPQNPRKDYDHLGTMVCWHRGYELGDEQPTCRPKDYPYDGVPAEDRVQLPLYLYDHSGITMSTQPFSCPWDSGQVGFIYVTLKKALENWNLDSFETWDYRFEDGESLYERAIACLAAEVEEYNAYLTGGVYSYEVIKDGEILDGGSGHFGIEDVRAVAKHTVDYLVQQETPKEREEELFRVD